MNRPKNKTKRRNLQFRILNKIGIGGTGIVYSAEDLSPDKLGVVAVKEIDPSKFGFAEAKELILKEAQVLLEIDSINVVRLHRVEEDTESKKLFLVMELAKGTLEELLDQNSQKLLPYMAAELIVQIARGVHEAHKVGIVHRDIKPSNILLVDGIPKVTDFGLAKHHIDAKGTSIPKQKNPTVTGIVRGTPGYMSPEQRKGERQIYPQSDVYGLGALLYRMITGMAPFDDSKKDSILLPDIIPTHPRKLNPDIPKDLETICLHCMKIPVAKRYPTAKAMADDVERFLKGEQIHAKPYSLIEKLTYKIRTHPGTTILISCIMVLVVVSGILSFRSSTFQNELNNRLESDAFQDLQTRYESRLLRAELMWEYRPNLAHEELLNVDDCPERLRDKDTRWQRLYSLATRPQEFVVPRQMIGFTPSDYGHVYSADATLCARAVPIRDGSPTSMATKYYIEIRDVRTGNTQMQLPEQLLHSVSFNGYSGHNDRITPRNSLVQMSFHPNNESIAVVERPMKNRFENGPYRISIYPLKEGIRSRYLELPVTQNYEYMNWLIPEKIMFAYHEANTFSINGVLHVVVIDAHNGKETLHLEHKNTTLEGLITSSSQKYCTVELRPDNSKLVRQEQSVYWIAVRNTNTGEIEYQYPLSEKFPRKNYDLTDSHRVQAAISQDGSRFAWCLIDLKSSDKPTVNMVRLGIEGK
jgi:serine/threonine protein kinase